MIELVETKDMKWIAANLDKIDERTKRHTKQIQELQKIIRREVKDEDETKRNL